ncbi:hypothetical protein MSG28_000604, partial [Choristoneura fumiferana]
MPGGTPPRANSERTFNLAGLYSFFWWEYCLTTLVIIALRRCLSVTLFVEDIIATIAQAISELDSFENTAPQSGVIKTFEILLYAYSAALLNVLIASMPACLNYSCSKFWVSMREDYSRAAQLVRAFDDVTCVVVFASFATNLIFICLQLYNLLSPLGGYENISNLIIVPKYVHFRANEKGSDYYGDTIQRFLGNIQLQPRFEEACDLVCMDLPANDMQPVCMMFSRYKKGYLFFVNQCHARRSICRENL